MTTVFEEKAKLEAKIKEDQSKLEKLEKESKVAARASHDDLIKAHGFSLQQLYPHLFSKSGSAAKLSQSTTNKLVGRSNSGLLRSFTRIQMTHHRRGLDAALPQLGSLLQSKRAQSRATYLRVRATLRRLQSLSPRSQQEREKRELPLKKPLRRLLRNLWPKNRPPGRLLQKKLLRKKSLSKS